MDAMEESDFEKKLSRELGKRMSFFREILSLTSGQWAKRLDIPEGTLLKIEAGEIFPDEDVIMTLHNDYGVSVVWLTAGKGQLFNHVAPCTPDYVYRAASVVPWQHPKFLTYVELSMMLEIPMVEEALDSKLTSAKRLFKDFLPPKYRQ